MPLLLSTHPHVALSICYDYLALSPHPHLFLSMTGQIDLSNERDNSLQIEILCLWIERLERTGVDKHKGV